MESGFLITLMGAWVASLLFVFPSETEKAEPKPDQPEPWLFPRHHQGVCFLPRAHLLRLVKMYFSAPLLRPLAPQPSQQSHFISSLTLANIANIAPSLNQTCLASKLMRRSKQHPSHHFHRHPSPVTRHQEKLRFDKVTFGSLYFLCLPFLRVLFEKSED